MRIIALMLLTWPLLATAVDYRTITGAGGVPLQIAESGDQSAPGILLIHGAALSSSSWLQQMNSSLADAFHLVAFDLRGHGNSGKPWDPAQYSDSKLWADDVAAVMQATGLKHPVIVGWSYGGHVTMDYLRHYSDDRIAGIVFVGSTGGMQPFPPQDPPRTGSLSLVQGRVAEPRRRPPLPDPGSGANSRAPRRRAWPTSRPPEQTPGRPGNRGAPMRG